VVMDGGLLAGGTQDPVGFVCGWKYCMDGKDCDVAVGIVAGFTGRWSGIILNPIRIHALWYNGFGVNGISYHPWGG
jgi:hypothetical protein